MFGIGYSCFIAGVLLPMNVYKNIYVYKLCINTTIHLFSRFLFSLHALHSLPQECCTDEFSVCHDATNSWDLRKGVGLSDGCDFGYFEALGVHWNLHSGII